MRCLTTAFALLLVFPLASCHSMATEEDKARLTALNRDFGTRFEFELASDLYVTARYRLEGSPTQGEAEEIFKAFWFSGNNPRDGSAFVYLNCYDRHGDFQFQLSYDPKTQRITRSSTEHY